MKKLNKQKLVKEMARERIGQPQATRLIPDKRNRPPKHKKKLEEI